MTEETKDLIAEYESAIRAMRMGRFDAPIPIDSEEGISKLGIELAKLSGELKHKATETEKLQQIKAMVGGSLDGFWVVDAKGHFLEVNDAYCHTIGYSRAELLNMTIADVEAMETPEDAAAHLQKVRETGSDRFETRHRCKDGSIIDVEVSVNFTELCGGRACCFVRDITERKRTQGENALKALLLDSASESIFLIDLNGNFVYVNDAAFRSRGYSREEFMSMNLRDLDPPEYAHLVGKRINDLLQHGHAVFESGHVHKDGHVIPIEASARVVEVEGRKLILSIAHDITERRKAQEHFFNANHDALTGLPNRRLLMDRLNYTLAQSKRSGLPMALLFLDIDSFKEINDRLGHDIGDELLKAVAARIVGCMREEDTVSRLGGDEFVVVLANVTSVDDVKNVTRKIMASVSAPLAIDEHKLRCTSSIGISIYPMDGHDAQTLMKHADKAMYRAKRAGRNCMRLYDEITG